MSILLKQKIDRFNQSGFTLSEILLSIALIGVIASISTPVYQAFQIRNDLDIAATSLVQTIRRAQLLSQAVDGDAPWGISVQLGSLVLFKGASYTARDSNFDEVFGVPTSITPSGTLEIVFAKFTGLPQTTGTITLTSNTNETRAITINAKGMVSY